MPKGRYPSAVPFAGKNRNAQVSGPASSVAYWRGDHGLPRRLSMLIVHSSAFEEGAAIPAHYAAGKEGAGRFHDVSPPLSWTGVPEGTRSIALTCVDHAPVAHEWLHWIVIDLPADLPFMTEGASGTRMMPVGSRELLGTNGAAGYHGPWPPQGSGVHPYEFTVWALDVESLTLPEDAGLAGLQAAVKGHVLGSGSITGTFER
jgi:Raf kinase inhibitor-like YbhB/YbcL family protein